MDVFQHRILRRAVFDEPEVWADDDVTSLVVELGCLLEQWPAPTNPTLDQIAIDRLTIAGHRVTILEFSKVCRSPEAFFVALVSAACPGAAAGTEPAIRFLTLELANRGPPQAKHTTLCEWGTTGRVNLGPGPGSEIGAFIEALRAVL